MPKTTASGPATNGSTPRTLDGAIACRFCGGALPQLTAHQRRKAFCNKACSARWRVRFEPGWTAKCVASMQAVSRVGQRRTCEQKARMSAAQQRRFQDPAQRQRMSDQRKGKTFLSRGGNGQLTKPQLALAAATGLPVEFSISLLGSVRQKFVSLPTHYKVDLADPSRMLAIEVDGASHRTAKWKHLDKRKTAVLAYLGWTVLRFWNEEVTADLEAVAQKISSFTTSK